MACVREPLPVYAGMILWTQLEFQKYKKEKFIAIMVEVWSESHIVWESLQTLSFQL